MLEAERKTDKHVLYKRSVQDAEAEVRFFNRVYRKLRGKIPLILREDFCGTAAVASEWVRSHEARRAYGIDLHLPTLRWGIDHHLKSLGKDASRVNLIHGNVLDRHPFKADVVAALNFSYFTFKERPLMLRYAKGVRQALAKDGIFVMDIFGGTDAMEVSEEETDHGDFIYVWDQASYNPVTGHIQCHIHFKMPGGRIMRRAFTYDWRLWTIPEMTDILLEAGFRDVQVYWEGTDKSSGDGNGVFRVTKRGDDSECYISYLVGVK